MDGPTTSPELRRALLRFEHLLANDSSESDYQRFFASHPYVLSQALPVRVSPGEIRPLARPGRSEADFIIYPGSPTGSYGIIELKRPDSKILTQPRNGIITLTRDAATAVAQAQTYSHELSRTLHHNGDLVVLGNRQVMFIIMGLTTDLTRFTTTGGPTGGLSNLLPPNCQLIPYDSLLASFERSIPPKLLVLIPERKLSTPTFDRFASGLTWAAFAWELWEITQEAFDYWESVETASRELASGGLSPRLINRSDFYVVGTTQFAPETPAPTEFGTRICRLMGDFAAAPSMSKQDARFFKIMSELPGVLARPHQHLSPQQITLLRDATAERMRGDREPFLQIGHPDVRRLEQLGLIKLALVDAGESYYYVHPLAPWIRA